MLNVGGNYAPFKLAQYFLFQSELNIYFFNSVYY